MSKPTWRRLIPWVVSVTLGVTATLGLAWGHRIWFRFHGVPPQDFEDRCVLVRTVDSTEFFAHGNVLPLTEHWLVVPVDEKWRPGYDKLIRSSTATIPYWVDTPKPGRGFQASATGWPFKSMKEVNGLDASLLPGCQQGLSQWGGNHYFEGRTLFTTIIWPGFLADTVLFAALAWSLLFAPRVIRRWRRHRQNCCRDCGYPRAGSAVCSECGAAAA